MTTRDDTTDNTKPRSDLTGLVLLLNQAQAERDKQIQELYRESDAILAQAQVKLDQALADNAAMVKLILDALALQATDYSVHHDYAECVRHDGFLAWARKARAAMEDK